MRGIDNKDKIMLAVALLVPFGWALVPVYFIARRVKNGRGTKDEEKHKETGRDERDATYRTERGKERNGEQE